MKTDSSKKAIIAVIVVLILCAGTYLGARSFTNRESQKITNPVVSSVNTVPSVYSTYPTAPSVTDSSVATSMLVPTDTTTAPASTTKPAITDSTVPTVNASGVITTYPSAEVSTTQTTQATTTTTTQAPSTQKVTAPPTTAAPVTDPNIKNASVFSNGFLSYMFNPQGNFYYTNDDPWQRNFGFNEVYDSLAGFVFMYYDTVRIKFTYAEKDWLVQFWKGQYGFVFIGAEIGVYNKPVSRTVEHYDCAPNEDCLGMSMTCQRDGVEIFSREYAKYWWCTGFVPGRLDSYSDRSELVVQARITMKDKKMLAAFTAGADAAGFKFNTNYTVDGLDVYIKW